MTKNASETKIAWSVSHLRSPVDGASIRYATCGSEQAKFGILFLNGRSEWIEKYDFLPEKIDFGQDVLWATMDHRGQGASEGPRAHVDSYDDFAMDVAALVRKVFAERPYGIIAHSMGGLITLYGSLKHFIAPSVVFLSSPLMGLKPPIPETIAKSVARIASLSSFGMLPTGAGNDRRELFPNNVLTSSYKGFQTVLRSPFTKTAPSFGWVHATYLALAEIYRPDLLKERQFPVKILVGVQEEVVDSGAYGAWVGAASRESTVAVEWRRLDKGRHELINEIEVIQKQVFREITSWFARHWLRG